MNEDLNPQNLKPGDRVKHASDKESIWVVTFVSETMQLPTRIHKGKFIQITCSRVTPECEQKTFPDIATNWHKI